LPGDNPYRAHAGRQTDQAVHERFFGSESPILPYSTDEEAALKVRARITEIYGYPVEIGQTRTRPRRFFARFDSGPSTATEALAETRALAICRLGLVIAATRSTTTR
jgi:hypothetical protein